MTDERDAAEQIARVLGAIVGVGCGVAVMLMLIPGCTNTDPIPLPQVDAMVADAGVDVGGGRGESP